MTAAPGAGTAPADMFTQLRDDLAGSAAAVGPTTTVGRTTTVGPGDVAAALGRSGAVVGHASMFAAVARARAELFGAGPLQPLVEDPSVTDVLVNGAHGVWVDRGSGLEPCHSFRLDEAAVRALAVRLAASCGQRLDDSCPVADGRLPDGTRLHAVLPPLCADGTAISLRTLRRRALRMAELVAGEFVGDEGAELLAALVTSRANVLVSGATGVGKTTLLAAMLSLVPANERIVCIEEAPELNPDHPHVLHLQVRRANVQGAGEIGLDQLVRAAVRMRPDRLVLGECRGAEVREVLGALNTGHDGGWATVHANAASDVPARLTALGALAGMDARSVAAQAVSAIDAVVHLRRRGGRRYLSEVAVLETDDDGRLVGVLAASVGRDGQIRPAPRWDRLAGRLEGVDRR